MTPLPDLGAYPQTVALTWQVGDVAVPLISAVGVRGHPGLDPALAAWAEAIARQRIAPPTEHALDASGGSGAIAQLVARRHGLAGRLLVTSAATRRAALRGALASERLVAAHPWELPERSESEVWWRPATERGWARVLAELDAWARVLRFDGRLVAVWHKDEGGKRAERAAAERFGSVEVRTRAGGWRVAELHGPNPAAPPPAAWLDWLGPTGPMRTLVGTFSADRLDAGTAALLAALETPQARAAIAGARVLDLGCGSGVISLWAARAGASDVLALDDDLAAVRSTSASAAGAPQVRSAWSDLTSDAPDARGVDVVLTNPPFHVGRQVVGALSEAFARAAAAALRPGGQLWLVANAALPFERLLASWDELREATPAGVRAYRVFAARRPDGA